MNMKSALLRITGFYLLAGSFLLQAQTYSATASAAPSPQVAQANAALAFLTPGEQVQYAEARAKALADNPDLKAEGEAVARQGANVMQADATASDKQAFIEQMRLHREKLRQAMLKEDPTLEPVFAKIDQHLSELKAKRLDEMQSSSRATNSPAPCSSVR